MDEVAPTPRTRLRRLPGRGSYDRSTIHAILDAGSICHVAFALEGQPYALPTSYGRRNDTLLIHGSSASRALRSLRGNAPVCVTVTHLDGLVLARSVFRHSMNYRSVVILGTAAEIVDADEKREALRHLTEHLIPGRWTDARQPTESELRATAVFAIPVNEASAKVRTGPPSDDEDDYALHVWAGVIPLHLAAGDPAPDSRLPADVRLPTYVAAYADRMAGAAEPRTA